MKTKSLVMMRMSTLMRMMKRIPLMMRMLMKMERKKMTMTTAWIMAWKRLTLRSSNCKIE
jgi:hypothetical protein